MSRLFEFLDWTACLGTTRLSVPRFIAEPANDPSARDFRWAVLSRTKSAHAIHDELAGQSNWLSVRAAIKPLRNMKAVVISRRIDEVELAGGAGELAGQWLKQQQDCPTTNSSPTTAARATHTKMSRTLMKYRAARFVFMAPR